MALARRLFLPDGPGPSGPGMALLSQPDGTIDWGVVGGSPWLHGSVLGSALRSTTDLLMSAYDTNAAATDHTSAFQAALAAAAAILSTGAVKVRIILDSRQKYTIGGPVTAGAHGEWAQIVLPFLTTPGTIQLVGIPRGQDYTYIGGGASGTVIESSLTVAPAYNATVGIASTFGGPASFCSTHTAATMYPAGFNYLRFATQDITIRSAAPVICGIDAGWMTGFQFAGLLQFDRDDLAAVNPVTLHIEGLWAQLNAPCTAPQAVPLILPQTLDWYGTIGDTLCCSGWLGGPYLGEFAHILRVIVFYNYGAALYVDGSVQASRIEYLVDWNNTTGIASYNPTSATPIAPTNPSQTAALTDPATPVEIGNWEVQITQGGGGPALTNRAFDLVDPNELVYIDCPSWISTTDAGLFNAAPAIYGSGPSSTGPCRGARIRSKAARVGQYTVFGATPASGTVIRNPTGRDGSLFTTAGAVTAININNVGNLAWTGSYPFPIPANASFSVTYTGNPVFSILNT